MLLLYTLCSGSSNKGSISSSSEGAISILSFNRTTRTTTWLNGSATGCTAVSATAGEPKLQRTIEVRSMEPLFARTTTAVVVMRSGRRIEQYYLRTRYKITSTTMERTKDTIFEQQ